MFKRSDLEYNISKDKKLFSSIKKCFENFEFNKFSKSKHENKNYLYCWFTKIWNFISRANFIIPQKHPWFGGIDLHS